MNTDKIPRAFAIISVAILVANIPMISLLTCIGVISCCVGLGLSISALLIRGEERKNVPP